MNLLIWVCLAQAIWPHVLAMYYFKSKEVFRPPAALPNDSFFGYSITYDQQNHKLIISSPRASPIGEVYECDIPKLKCTIIKHNITRISGTFKHDYWFGSTVKAGPDFILMCTPRYIERNPVYDDLGTYGRCYSYSHGTLKLLPSINPNDRKKNSPDLFEASMDSFGWSLDVAFDDSVIVGSPVMSNGRAMIYPAHDLQQTPKLIKKDRRTPSFNFGYGVSSGKFINNKISYAASSTYGKHGLGEVQFFTGIEWQYNLKNVDQNSLGSMFGAVLCAAKLNGMMTDLLVGAPTYALKSSYNTGAVHVYLSHTGKAPRLKRTIKGTHDGGLFGSAIINLGDLDGDNKDDVAIGAPFENGDRGAVYIYSGADLISDLTELTLEHLQKIEPEATSTFGKGFGLSLTTLQDYDDNGCNELAIGAPYSDRVFLLYCCAAITVDVSATFPNLQNRGLSGKTKTDFQFNVCLSVEYPLKPRNIIARLSTTVEMRHPNAKLTKPNDKGTYTIKTLLNDKQAKYCYPVDFTLPPDGNYETPIDYQITSRLLDNPLKLDHFNGSYVILSNRSVLTLRDSVWATECSGNECVPHLQWEATFSFKNGYKIGSTNKESFEISVNNTGEVAYDACVRVHLVGVRVFKPAPYCEVSTNGDDLLCAPSKPLKSNSTWATGDNILYMASLTNLDRKITIEASIFNHCKVNKSLNSSHEILLEGDPKGVDVIGVTKLGDVVSMTTTEAQSDGKNMEHIYTIVNKGVTDWVGVTSVVSLEKKPYIKYNPKPVTVYVGNAASDCLLDASESKDVMNFTCKISRIERINRKQEVIKIVVPINIVAGTLDGILDINNNVTINSYMTLLLEHGKMIEARSERIISTIQLQDAVVPLWVIILATLVGLFILIIIAWSLYECGFLRRKNREELKKLQHSVKRQTIRRSTMQTQSRPEDRRQILEHMNEENEAEHNEGAVI